MSRHTYLHVTDVYHMHGRVVCSRDAGVYPSFGGVYNSSKGSDIYTIPQSNCIIILYDYIMPQVQLIIRFYMITCIQWLEC